MKPLHIRSILRRWPAVLALVAVAGWGGGGTAFLLSRGGVLNADAIHFAASGVGGGSDPSSYYN